MYRAGTYTAILNCSIRNDDPTEFSVVWYHGHDLLSERRAPRNLCTPASHQPTVVPSLHNTVCNFVERSTGNLQNNRPCRQPPKGIILIRGFVPQTHIPLINSTVCLDCVSIMIILNVRATWPEIHTWQSLWIWTSCSIA